MPPNFKENYDSSPVGYATDVKFTPPVNGKCPSLAPGQPETEVQMEDCASECLSAQVEPKMMKLCCPRDPTKDPMFQAISQGDFEIDCPSPNSKKCPFTDALENIEKEMDCVGECGSFKHKAEGYGQGCLDEMPPNFKDN